MSRFSPALLSLALLAGCSATNRSTPQQDASTVSSEAQAEPASEPVVAASPAESSTPPAEDAAEGEVGQAAENSPATPTFDVSGWNTIVSTYVTDDGGFRYEALRANEEHLGLLNAFVQSIGAAQPDSWSRDEQLAFYINAYNALTIKSVIELWPVTSVMRERGFFRSREHQVAGSSITLDHLENQIIRTERFSEPRIHFLVNCASVGCPPLANRAITSENLEGRLEQGARAFVRASTRIDRRRGRTRLSQIFEWFGGDFSEVGGVRGFVASHLDEEDATFVRDTRSGIGFYDYDWTLNGRN